MKKIWSFVSTFKSAMEGVKGGFGNEASWFKADVTF